MKPSPQKKDLPSDYYLNNFHRLLNDVFNQYGDLLTEGESAFYHQFNGLTSPAQRLYIRLVSRRGSEIRQDKLNYVEIPDIARHALILAEKNFIAIDPDLESAEHLALFTKPELKQFFSSVKKTSSLSKTDLVEAIETHTEEENIRSTLNSVTPILQPLHADLLAVYQLCFFGNAYQDLTEFVLEDLGMVKYETYVIKSEDRSFHNRESIEKTYEYGLMSDELYLYLSESDETEIFSYFDNLPLPGNDVHLIRCYSRLCNQLARQCERLEANKMALSIYQHAQHTPSRERQSRIYAKQKQLEKALSICEDILLSPEDDDEHEFAIFFGHQLKKKLGLKALKEKPTPIEEEHLCLSREWLVELESVELAAALHYELIDAEVVADNNDDSTENDNAEKCFYVENQLFLSLFGLFFWDIIFSSVPGAFDNHYQRGPRGLFSPDFYKLRYRDIDKRLKQLQKGESWKKTILKHYKNKFGLANHLVHWSLFEDSVLLSQCLDHIPSKHLHSLFHKMSRDLGHYNTGFPDLIFFPPTGGYQLIEVKGPGDKLQKNQKRWLRFFFEEDIPALVSYVTWDEEE